jgi:hypothetical protein
MLPGGCQGYRHRHAGHPVVDKTNRTIAITTVPLRFIDFSWYFDEPSWQQIEAQKKGRLPYGKKNQGKENTKKSLPWNPTNADDTEVHARRQCQSR